MMMRYILADPFLVDESGHCLSYIEALKQCVTSNGAECVVVGNQLANRNISGNFLGLFSEKTIDRASGIVRLMDRFSSISGASRSLSGDLKRIDEAVRFSAQDVLIINSLRQQHLGGIFRYFSSISADRHPYVIIIFHFTSLRKNGSYNNRFVRFTNNAFHEMKYQLSDRFIFLTDTEELSNEYNEMHDTTTLTAPIPHANSTTKTGDNKNLNVSFIGQARKDKGFYLLPSIIMNTIKNISNNNVIFHAQCYSPNKITEHNETVEKLRKMGVVTYDNPLSSIEYKDLMNLSDIIMLPYEPHPYTRQSSGVFAEALAASKVIIAPRHTWMGRQLEKYATGLTFEPGDEESLANAVLRAINEYGSFHQEALDASEAWRRFHNPENFMKIVAERINSS